MNILIGAACRRHTPSRKPKKIYFKSYKNVGANEYLNDIASVPFHVTDIFDDVDDTAWFYSSLIRFKRFWGKQEP